MSSSIVLTTLNARYSHASLALRYLYANLHALHDQACLLEFTIQDTAADILETILRQQPRIVGFAVYIWNALETQRVVELLKKVSPEVTVVLGGPEVSYLPQRVDFARADYIIPGEGEWAFYALCQAILAGEPPAERTFQVPLGDLNALTPPYAYYTDHDLAHRITYVEASRGCPFTCEFCLSSLDQKVRKFATEAFLAQLEALWRRGARNFKFIDRTFNLSPTVTRQILEFFLAKPLPYFVHFEMIPDHFPPFLRELLQRFAPTTLQLEIGIQTLDPEVSARIRRKLKPEVVRDNLEYLAAHTHAHLHLDLIVGLPGESLAGFGRNLDALASWTESEIQIGILKKLSGTDLFRHDQAFGMVYADAPPYEILKNHLISFQEMQFIKRFARFWNLTYNSGHFKRSIRLLWPDGEVYRHFGDFTRWLYAQTQATSKIALARLAELLFTYLTEVRGYDTVLVAELMYADLEKTQGIRTPKFLQTYLTTPLPQTLKTVPKHIKRQVSHGGGK